MKPLRDEQWIKINERSRRAFEIKRSAELLRRSLNGIAVPANYQFPSITEKPVTKRILMDLKSRKTRLEHSSLPVKRS